MSRERPKGDWKRLKGKARQGWGELTDEDLDLLEGRRERGIGLHLKKKRRVTTGEGSEDRYARHADPEVAR